jgi:aminopeptidase YwaD
MHLTRVTRYLVLFGLSAAAIMAVCLLAWPAGLPDPWHRRPGQPAPRPPEPFSASRAMAHVNALAVDIGPRVMGTAQERRAFDYCARQLRAAGLKVRLQRGVKLPGLRRSTCNLAAETPRPCGPGLLILGAHVDSAGRALGSRGAMDNASGVAVLLEVARACARAQLPFRLRVLIFGGEEYTRPARDLWHIGSPAYVANLSEADCARCLAMLSVDAVAGPGTLYAIPPDPRRPQPPSTPAHPFPYKRLAQVARRAHIPLKTVAGRDNSDHAAFAAAGIASAWLTRLDAQPLWHTGADVPAAVEPAQLAEAGRLLMQFLAATSAATPPAPGGRLRAAPLRLAILPRSAAAAPTPGRGSAGGAGRRPRPDHAGAGRRARTSP